MQSRPLGRTGLLVSRLGLGLAALGRPGYINLGHHDDVGADKSPQAMKAAAFAVLDAAYADGVRYFDAARSYGEGEQFLASWLRERRLTPADVVVGSKWGYTYTAGWSVTADKHEVKDHSLPVLMRQARESRQLLGDHLGLYQVHSATLESGVLDDAAVLAHLMELKRRGLKIGLTLTGPRQADTLHKALETLVDGERVFDAVQATWNVLEPSCGDALHEARTAGLGVIVKEGLANGRLTERNDEPSFAGRRALLRGQADRFGCSLDALALAAVLAQPWADVVLSGAATAGHLRSNLLALSVNLDLEALAVLRGVAEPAEDYWGRRGMLAWN